MTKIERAVRGPGMSCIALRRRDDELYVFLWDDGRQLEAIQVAADMADNRALSFTWADATLFARRSHDLAKEALRDKGS